MLVTVATKVIAVRLPKARTTETPHALVNIVRYLPILLDIVKNCLIPIVHQEVILYPFKLSV